MHLRMNGDKLGENPEEFNAHFKFVEEDVNDNFDVSLMVS